VRPKGLGKLKTFTLRGLELATFRRVAQCLTTTLPRAPSKEHIVGKCEEVSTESYVEECFEESQGSSADDDDDDDDDDA
jgi:hypothetical protein